MRRSRPRPPVPPRSYNRPMESPPSGSSGFGMTLNYMTMAVLGGIFIIGIGIGVAFSSTASFDPENVASREAIDRSAPNPELCIQYGASAVVADARVFITFSPFSVYLSQPVMQPGCVIRSNNWAVLEQRKAVDSETIRDCRNRMNTFGYTGDINNKPKVDCIYQNDSAGNLFLNQPGFSGPPPESNKF